MRLQKGLGITRLARGSLNRKYRFPGPRPFLAWGTRSAEMRDGGPRKTFLFSQPREIREQRDTIDRQESGEIQQKMYLLRAPYIFGGETNGPIRGMEACAKNSPSQDHVFFLARGLMGRYERGKLERKSPLPGTPFTFGRASHQPVWAREGRPENAFLLTIPRTFGEANIRPLRERESQTIMLSSHNPVYFW